MPKLARCLHNLYLFMCGFGPPLTQFLDPRMFIQLPDDEHNYIFFIHQYDVCNSKNSCTYQPSNQAIKVAIKIQGCEQGVIEEEDI